MSHEAEDQVTVPDSEQERAVSREALTTEHLSEFAEWLDEPPRVYRFDRIGSRTTRQFSEDMARTRRDVTHLHERMGQLMTGNQHALKSLLQKKIRAALEQDRYALARAHHPCVQVKTTEVAHRHDPPVARVDIRLPTGDRAASDQVRQRQCGPLTTAAGIASCIGAALPAFRCVDPVQPNALAPDLQRVAIDHRGHALKDGALCICRARDTEQRQQTCRKQE